MTKAKQGLFGIVRYGSAEAPNTPFSRGQAKTLISTGKAGLLSLIDEAFATRGQQTPSFRELANDDFLGAQLLLDAARAGRIELSSIVCQEELSEECVQELRHGISTGVSRFMMRLAQEYQDAAPGATAETVSPHAGAVYIPEAQLGFIAPVAAKQLLVPYYT